MSKSNADKEYANAEILYADAEVVPKTKNPPTTKKQRNNFSLEIMTTATKEDIQEILGNSLKWYGRKVAKTDEEVEERLHEYFQALYDTGELPTVEKMACALGTTRKTLWEWENGSQGEYRAELIKNAKEILASMDAELVCRRKIPETTYIFRSKNHFGMVDQQQVQVEAKPIEEEQIDREALAEKYLHDIPAIPSNKP